jgi:DNA-binding helix-turn-helix protein
MAGCGGRRRVANNKRRANSRHRQQAASGKQRTADSGQRTADSEQQKVDERKPVTGGALRTFCRAAKDAATGLRKLPNLTYLCTMRRKNERYNEPVVRGVVAQLRELRHARNLSQKQVFTDTDINIGRIESGRGNISVSTLADLCAYYGIPLREFFERLEAGIASGE